MTKSIQARTPEDPNLIWTASHVVLLPDVIAPQACNNCKDGLSP